MLADVLRVGIGAVPIAESGLLTNHTFARDQFTIPQNVGPSLFDSRLTVCSLIFNDFHIAVEVYIDLAVDLTLEILVQWLPSARIFEKRSQLWLLTPVDILNVLEALCVTRLLH